MATFISHNPQETQALGRRWGQAAQAGWVIGLSGDLGAGKTELVRGLAQGLGFSGRIHSPTFALVHHYEGGRLPLFHLDLYRLESSGQVLAAGLEEYLFQPKGVAVVEWFERWLDWRPHPAPQTLPYRLVFIDTLNEQERRIQYENFGD